MTILEMMIALVIFSTLLGLSSHYIAATVQKPFVVDRVEPWMNFIEAVNTEMSHLPDHSGLRTEGIHENPFPDIEKPTNFSQWWLEWVDENLDGYAAARFTVITKQDRKIEWIIYKEDP